MKKITAVIFSILFLFSNHSYADYELLDAENDLLKFKIAFELCLKEKDESGFIAAKSAMKTYKFDPDIILLLKSASCWCIVNPENFDEIIEFADDVITSEKNPLYVGIAWFRKAWVSYQKDEYSKCISFSKIATHILEKIPPQCDKGNIPFNELYAAVAHLFLKEIYLKNDMKEEYDKECIALNKYEWVDEKYKRLNEKK